MRIGAIGQPDLTSHETVATATTPSAATTATWGVGKVVRVVCSTNSFFSLGASPTAANTSPLITQGSPIVMIVKAASTKFAFLTQTSTGYCSVTELN